MKTSKRNIERTRDALEGLSVGDAFGERFFGPTDLVAPRIASRSLPPATWGWTDDTAMALSIFETLRDHGAAQPDALAGRFARRYVADPTRGYGAGAHRLLLAIAEGARWSDAAAALFNGGSFGNGAAMRVAPLGAYFCDDFDAAAAQADASARPTHAHPEGRAGAIAIAVAAAFAAKTREQQWDIGAFFDTVKAHTPHGAVHANIIAAEQLGPAHPKVGAEALGSGQRVTAQDTVGYSVWCAAHHADDYEAAMWHTVAGLGDRDTTCAIVGGIVAARVGTAGIPMQWRHSRELLDIWP